MISRATLKMIFLVMICLLLSNPSPAIAQSSVRSVESFVGIKSRWENLVGVSLKIEGRYSSLGGKLLRFQNCDLPFRSNENLPKLGGRTNTVEVSGKLIKEKGKLYFAVEKVRELPKDLQSIRDRQRKNPPMKPDDWYDLGAWAIGRSKFYEDEELADEASEIYMRGVRLAEKQVPKDDPAALFALAKQIESFPVPNSLRYTFLHNAYWIQWNTILKEGEKTHSLDQLKVDIEKNLPGCRNALPMVQPKQMSDYLKDPLKKYLSADENTRKHYHRIFYSEVLLKQIFKDRATDGSNGFEIAKKIKDSLPERNQSCEDGT